MHLKRFTNQHFRSHGEDNLIKYIQLSTTELVEELKNRIKKDNQIASHTTKLPLSILLLRVVRCAPMTLVARATKFLRDHHVKQLYTVLNSMTSLNKKSIMAHSFDTNSLLAKGLPLNYSFADYLNELCWKADQDDFQHHEQIDNNEPQLTITAAEVAAAIRRIGAKAPGVDCLSAHLLKSLHVRTLLSTKLARQFTSWINSGSTPKYMK